MVADFDLAGLLDSTAGNGAASTGFERVPAFDRPGFGHRARPADRRWGPEEQADPLLRAMDLLGVDRATVLGHSWGTLVAIAMALQAPQRIDHLILVSRQYYSTPRIGSWLIGAPALPRLGT